VRLVADANVLLSAATGGRAALILARPDLAEIVTTASAMAELQEYAEPLARRLGLPLQTVLLTIATLPVSVIAG
jgi:predicted nucleic acid-binding protein